MKKTKIITWILVLLLIYLLTGLIKLQGAVLAMNKAEKAQEALQAKINAMTTVELIDYIAPQYGQDPALIKKITHCESGHNPNVVHDGGYGKGSTGFHRKTFEAWKKEFNHPEYNYESNYDQIALMSEAFSKGEKYRDDWTTYVAYKNGGTYTFYSQLLQKNFVVVCK